MKIVSLVKIFASTNRVNIIKTDPSDNIFLDCALASGADFIVSGDNHLLELRQYKNITILAPAIFLKLITKK
ncbi:MAG: putative toxin-antitoxin system toxin component, PIN family [Patescibacteria group bacterium]